MRPEFTQQVTFLYTADLAKTAEFYESILELPLVLDQSACRIYHVGGGAFLGFCEHLTSGEQTRGVIITLVSKDVDGWYATLRQKGVAFEKAPQHNEKFNIYHCFLRDPNGYLLEIQRFLDPILAANVEVIHMEPRTKFDWLIYADGTFAGLSLLIPIPLLDVAFAWFFRRRMIGTIARRNGRSLPRPVVREVNQNPDAWWRGCLTAPFALIFLFLKRLSRKLLYFLTVKEATDELSYYWHRAFLLDHMVRRGDLDDLETAVVALQAMRQVLDEQATSPLQSLAGQILAGASHVLRTAVGWTRRGQEDEVVQSTRAAMASSWSDFDDYFAALARQYESEYSNVASIMKNRRDAENAEENNL